MRNFLSLIALIAFLACDTISEPAASKRVLFAGNSLTYTNDLPKLVKELAAMDGFNWEVKSISLPDYSLEDHWNDGDVQKELAEGKYDLLIGQQGPSAMPESQQLLKHYSVLFSNECKKHHTTFGLYGVWPALKRSVDLDNCIQSYANAAKESHAVLCPAGMAWKIAWSQDPMMPLYGTDNFHPGIHGSVLAAMVIYASVQEKKDLDFINHNKVSWRKMVSGPQLEIMRVAALEAVSSAKLNATPYQPRP